MEYAFPHSGVKIIGWEREMMMEVSQFGNEIRMQEFESRNLLVLRIFI